MSTEERQQRFLELMNDATRLTGVTLTVVTQTRTFDDGNKGKVTQTEASLALVLVPDWTPPAP